MFCTNCGNKLSENSKFCPKCGQRVEAQTLSGEADAALEVEDKRESEPASVPEPVEKPAYQTEPKPGTEQKTKIKTEPAEKTVQEAETIEEIHTVSEDNKDICTLIKTNIDRCPVIKSAKQFKKRVRLRGRLYSHSARLVTAHTVQVRIRSMLAFPFSILYGLFAGLLCVIIWVILAEFAEYGSICWEYYHSILLALCFLVSGAILFMHTLTGRKEKDAVENYVCKIAESKQIYLSERKRIIAPAIKIAASAVLIVAGIIILPLSIPNPMGYYDELLFCGYPAARILEMDQKDIEEAFGEADYVSQNGITKDDYYDYSYHYSDDIRHVVYSKETGTVIYIEFSGELCTYNCKNLSKSMVRVLDILEENLNYVGNSMRIYSGVYGSMHSGFYYDDGVYLGNFLGTYFEDSELGGYTVQKEFEDQKTFNYRFYTLRTWGEADQRGWRELREDYEIALITTDWKDYDEPYELYGVCLYTDEWIKMVSAEGQSDTALDGRGPAATGNGTTDSEEYLLNETYMNEEEGFSFNYPDIWTVESEDAYGDHEELEGIAVGYAPAESGFSANMVIGKSVVDEAYFTANASELEAAYAGLENFEMVSLADITLSGHPARKVIYKWSDSNGDYSSIQYFYIAGNDMYFISCTSLADLFYKYESVFEAVMDSYTITAVSDTPGTQPEAGNDAILSASEEAAKQILMDWLLRHPLKHNCKVEFLKQTADAGDGTSYLLYEMYLDQEEYGLLGVNPDSGEIVMDTILDGYGNPVTIKAAMDQWYLVYYWGWTDDSGYYSEYYGSDLYGVFDGEGTVILEYNEKSDSYVICNFDLICLIEYDDGTEASEVSMMDFAGTYWCDTSAVVEGTLVEDGYALEIGEWDGSYFSINESWRGIDIIQDEWANPQSLVAGTLTFWFWGSEGYETHTLQYIPAKYSPLG